MAANTEYAQQYGFLLSPFKVFYSLNVYHIGIQFEYHNQPLQKQKEKEISQIEWGYTQHKNV